MTDYDLDSGDCLLGQVVDATIHVTVVSFGSVNVPGEQKTKAVEKIIAASLFSPIVSQPRSSSAIAIVTCAMLMFPFKFRAWPTVISAWVIPELTSCS